MTSRDVAQALGIAQSTVSRAFTPGASISGELRERIHAAADRIGYRPNLLARGLIAGRSRLIGMLIAPQTNLLYPELLYELACRLAAEDHQLLLFPAADEAAATRAVERLRAFRVDAVLATGILGEAGARALVADGVRLVTFNRLIDGIAGVSCDFVGTGASLARGLLADGRRRLALIFGPDGSWVSGEFERGVRAELAGADAIGFAAVSAPYSRDAAADALARAERSLGCPADAILCVNDTVAAGCVDALEAHARRVPEEVAVVTILRDDPGGGAIAGVRQPIARMIDAAVELLLSRPCRDDRIVLPAEPIA